MQLELVIPLSALAFAGVGLAVVVALSGKQKRLEERVLANVPRGHSVPRVSTFGGPDVRIRPTEATRWNTIYALLNIPVDLPLANLVSPIWILMVVTVFAALAMWGTLFLASWWFSVLDALILWVIAVRTAFGWELDRYRGQLLRQLPDTIHLVISATRAGLPVSESFRTVVLEMPNPTSAEFVQVVDEMALGVSPDDALLNMHRRTGVTEYAIFAVTIGVQARSGGRLAETITNLAETVRDRIGVSGKARALSAEARTAATIMAILPIVTGLLLELTRPGYLRPLIDDPRGQTMLLFGLITLVLGMVTMRQLIRGATRD
jgi:tight adherence protein B